MRGGLRLPAVVVVIGLLAGCSDPAGAVRRERAAARKSSPSPTPGVTPKKAAAKTWWQAPGKVRTAHGLRVHTGTLRPGSMRVAVTDVSGHAARTITATSRAHGAVIGHFTLTGVKLAKSPKTGTYGVTFHYHRR
jgi:hypothetical protein